jgi:CRP/FNR family transcriptional regulator
MNHTPSSANECHNCRHRLLCTPDTPTSAHLSGRRIRVPRREALLQAGTPTRDHLYAIRSGSFKLLRDGPSGAARIVGFAMPPDMLALGDIGLARRASSAVALEDSEVCEIAPQPLPRQGMQTLLAQQIRREQDIALMLRDTTAEQRLAAFLLSLSQRHAANGYSASRFRLQMARSDIANFLGLTAECISRLIIQFRQRRLVDVQLREISDLDVAALDQLVAVRPARITSTRYLDDADGGVKNGIGAAP